MIVAREQGVLRRLARDRRTRVGASQSPGSRAPRWAASPADPARASARGPSPSTRVAEALADLVLLHLQLSPVAARARATAVRASRGGGSARRAAAGARAATGRRPRPSCLGVALDQGHRRLHPLHQLPALLAEPEAQHLAFDARAPHGARRVCVGPGPQAGRPPRLLAPRPPERGTRRPPPAGRRSAPPSMPPEVLAQPRRPSELHRMGDLVDRGTHAVNSSRSRLRLRAACARFGAEQQQARGHVVRLQQRDVVLAEHALGEHPRDGAHLRAEQQLRGRAHGGPASGALEPLP